MNELKILIEAEQYVRSFLENDSSGHDWWHIHRVRSLARQIAAHEGADIFICELTALLHDVADEKLFDSEEERLAELDDWLLKNDVESDIRAQIVEIIKNMSYKGGNNLPVASLEGKVVQDADRLDAIGAIGIARTFAYSGAKGQLIYDPTIAVREEMSKEEYRGGQSTAINHFYEKLLKLKDLMNTEYGKQLAEERHQFLEEYLQRFQEEWNV